MSSKKLAITQVELAGTVYPVSFGNWALITFEERTGIGPAGLQGILSEGKLRPMIELFYCGLVDGHRKAKEPFEMTIEEVADEIFDLDPDYSEKMLNAFISVLPQATPEEVEAEEEKKKGVHRPTYTKAKPPKKN